MYGYVYKTTNLVDGKIYIGKHKSDKFDDSYIGSGVILKRAIEKYGVENFKCEVIEECNNLQELNESEIRNIKLYESFNRDVGYNIATGGDGGNTLQYMSEESFQKRNKNISNSLKGHPVSKETREKFSRAKKKWTELNPGKQREINKLRYSDGKLNKIISDALKEKYEKNPELKEKISFRQKKLWDDEEYRERQSKSRSSKEYKDLMTEKLKGKTLGHKVINNGKVIKKVPESELSTYLSDGWELGTLPFSKEHRENIRKSKLNCNSNHLGVKVVCVTTGEIFNSKKDASSKFGISKYLLDKSIECGVAVNGLVFKIEDSVGGD